MAGDGGTQRLPRKIGANMASYMLMTGEPIDAETAF
jgi:enoyl-CoA hydratase/carnithine racemase